MLQQATPLLLEKTAHLDHFDLPLEEFSVERFNELLVFLGVRGCQFTRIVHLNRGGSYSSPADAASAVTDPTASAPLLSGTCRLDGA